MRMKKRVPNKKRDLIISIICIVVISISLSLTGLFLFQHFHYDPFWVSGQSMYPTLNKDAKYADGTLVGEKHSRPFEEGEYDVDYGFMVTSKKAINKIKRFDIVVFEAGANLVSYNIKRVIALPGETFYITSEAGDNNGSLYVQSGDSYNYIEQPISKDLVSVGLYPVEYTTPHTLGSNEYFVMGDNRKGDNSYDSRLSGPIKKELILGVAKGLNGKATLGYNKDGVYTVTKVKHFWPRFF